MVSLFHPLSLLPLSSCSPPLPVLPSFPSLHPSHPIITRAKDSHPNRLTIKIILEPVAVLALDTLAQPALASGVYAAIVVHYLIQIVVPSSMDNYRSLPAHISKDGKIVILKPVSGMSCATISGSKCYSGNAENLTSGRCVTISDILCLTVGWNSTF